uniref:Uncharacterized protein n=1 Tax=Triticum urartu TaxID=4572 RepID=A0A8R7QD65_TRIUA
MGRTETERRPAAAVLLRRYFSRCRWPARYGRKVVEKQDDGGHRRPDLELALFDVVCLGVVLLLPPRKAVARPGLDARVLAYIMPTICAMICLG